MKTIFLCIFIALSANSQEELWLQASRFFPPIEESVDIFFYKGLNFKGINASYSTEIYNNFKHFGPKAKKISDENGLIKVKFIEEGTHIITIETTERLKKYTNTEFQNYINEHTIEGISLKDMPQNITEISQEYAKMLIQVGKNTNEIFDLEANQRLEIIPIDNPFGDKSSVSFKIMFDQKPISGQTLQHFTKTNNQTTMDGLHSDKNGIVNYSLTRGLHLLKIRYTIPSSDRTQSDFETHTASLTFGKK